MTFATIFTRAGRAALATATVTKTALRFTAMAVGDGAGNPVTPSDEQAELVRETYRSAVNRLYKDPSKPTQFIAELTIPADVGGFTLREVGLFDSNGTLVAVGNLPETYKPTPEDGAVSDTVVRLVFSVSNASLVELLIDPNVAVATQTWVTNNVTARQVLPGGTYHQVLRKASNTDGDVEWADPSTAEIIVDPIEEVQQLADGQTVVNLLLCTTRGLVLYANGQRLRTDEWTPHASIDTQLTLAAAYPAGTRLICVQNEPNASLPRPLLQSNNLADLTSLPVARKNLGVPSIADLNDLLPVGFVTMDAGISLAGGWLPCNGAVVKIVNYPALYARIGNTFNRPGSGADGVTTFQLPDFRGLFPRALDEGRGIDPNRAAGSEQADALGYHQHMFGSDDQISLFGYENAGPGFGYDANSGLAGDGRNLRTKQDPAYPMSTETRPKNFAIRFVIKARPTYINGDAPIFAF